MISNVSYVGGVDYSMCGSKFLVNYVPKDKARSLSHSSQQISPKWNKQRNEKRYIKTSNQYTCFLFFFLNMHLVWEKPFQAYVLNKKTHY